MKILVLILFAMAILINPSGAGNAGKEALLACGNTVIPSLFPFFVCSRMLIELGAAEKFGNLISPVMKPIFGVGGNGALAFVIGILSGYPVGASTVSEMVRNGKCTKSEAEKLLGYCNNSGPIFIIGALGAGLLGNASLGRILYLSHILSAFTTAIFMRGIPCEISETKSESSAQAKNFGEIMSNAVSGGAESVFNVCGYVIIFAILADAIEYFGFIRLFSILGIDYNVCKVLVSGFLEPVGGSGNAVAIFSDSPILKCIALSVILGWSGISVHLQVLGIIKKAGLSARYYFLGKVGMSIISPIYTYALLKLFPKVLAVPVFAPARTSALVFPHISCLVCAGVIFAIVIQLLSQKTIE